MLKSKAKQNEERGPACRFCHFLKTYISNKNPAGHSIFCKLCVYRSKRTKTVAVVCPLCEEKHNIEIDGVNLNQVDVDLIKLVAATEKDRPEGSSQAEKKPLLSIVEKVEALDISLGDLGTKMRKVGSVISDTTRKVNILEQYRDEIARRQQIVQANLTHIADMKNNEQKIQRIQVESNQLNKIAASQEKLTMAVEQIAISYQSVKDTLLWIQEVMEVEKKSALDAPAISRKKSHSFGDVNYK